MNVKFKLKTDIDYGQERRTFNRFPLTRHRIEVDLIVDDYKRFQGLALIENLSMGGMCLNVKEEFKAGTKVKFYVGKKKTMLFHGRVAWSKTVDIESYPFQIGVNFEFPHPEDAEKQKRELLAFVMKELSKLPKDQLVDRLMELFIERRRIYESATERLQEMEKDYVHAKNKVQESQERARNIIELSLTGVLYLDRDLKILYSNEAIHTFLKYSSTEIKECHLHNIAKESTGKLIRRYYKDKNTNIYNGVFYNIDGDECELKWRVFEHQLGDMSALCLMISLGQD